MKKKDFIRMTFRRKIWFFVTKLLINPGIFKNYFEVGYIHPNKIAHKKNHGPFPCFQNWNWKWGDKLHLLPFLPVQLDATRGGVTVIIILYLIILRNNNVDKLSTGRVLNINLYKSRYIFYEWKNMKTVEEPFGHTIG